MELYTVKLLCVIIQLLCLAFSSLASVYTVGDASGWSLGGDFSTWTSRKTFAVGDTLVFNYGSGHTVDEVSKSDYETCTVGNAIATDNSGTTTVRLKKPGKHYFICGVIGHCGSGMKLSITVDGSPAPAPSDGGSTAFTTVATAPTMTAAPPPSSGGGSSAATVDTTSVSESSASVAVVDFIMTTWATWFVYYFAV